MKRRRFIHSALAAGVGAGAAPDAESAGEQFLTLGWYRARRDLDLERLRGHLSSWSAAANRAGVQPVGAFQVMIGPDNPSFLVVAAYPSMAALEEKRAKIETDETWRRESAAFDEKWDLAYERMETSLLRGFRTFPGIEQPKSEGGKPNVFELRTYESRSTSAHRKKVAMFDGGEIAIFRRVGIHPVFFGSTVFGPRMPSLTYLVYYPSWEARAEAWSRFGSDAEWKKLAGTPGNADRELVSAISNQLLQPLPFSQIK
jgi:hypothetical protein